MTRWAKPEKENDIIIEKRIESLIDAPVPLFNKVYFTSKKMYDIINSQLTEKAENG